MLPIGNIVRKTQPAAFWCMRGLPRAEREAIYTLFAFYRHIDNIVNSSMPSAEKLELLNAWREEMDNIYDINVPATDIGRKIYKNCLRFNLPKNLWKEILDSALLDAPTPLFQPDEATFEKYIRGTAVVPFELFLMIVGGCKPVLQKELANNLGRALLFTTILRDVKEDAQMDRVYISKELLQKFEIDSKTPRTVVENKNFIYAREEMAHQAEKSYAKASRILSHMNRQKTMPLNFVKNLNECYFNIMNTRGWEIISPKPKVSFGKRLQIAAKTIFG